MCLLSAPRGQAPEEVDPARSAAAGFSMTKLEQGLSTPKELSKPMLASFPLSLTNTTNCHRVRGPSPHENGTVAVKDRCKWTRLVHNPTCVCKSSRSLLVCQVDQSSPETRHGQMCLFPRELHLAASPHRPAASKFGKEQVFQVFWKREGGM